MDRGRLFTQSFQLLPGDNESFVIRLDRYSDPGSIQGGIYGFTSVDDLLKFLADEAEAFKSRKQPGA
mgnify:CR=1 FL=1